MTNKLNKMVFDKFGQHIIEYTTILILVMAGIIVMGPYVIRSWNAHLKGWEDSTRDSITDPLTPDTDTDIDIQGCVWFWQPVACGPAEGSGCTQLELTEIVKSTPEDCHLYVSLPNEPENNPADPEHAAPPWRCVADLSCCLDTPLACADDNPANNNGQAECALGHRQIRYICGADATEYYRCDPDPLCVYSCYDVYGIPTMPNVALCADDDQGLPRPTVRKTVMTCTDTVWQDKCQYVCTRQGPPDYEVPMGYVDYGALQGTHATRCDSCPANTAWSFTDPEYDGTYPDYCPAGQCHSAADAGIACGVLPPGAIGWCYRWP